MKPLNLWKEYVVNHPEDSDKKYGIFNLGDNKEAKNLINLIMNGIKTATSSCLYSYRTNSKQLPKKDDINIVTDLKGSAFCIIKNINVNVVRYNQFNAKMALLEGEGDKSLKYWRSVHEPIFISDCEKINKTFNDSTPIIFEEFTVVYKKD